MLGEELKEERRVRDIRISPSSDSGLGGVGIECVGAVEREFRVLRLEGLPIRGIGCSRGGMGMAEGGEDDRSILGSIRPRYG